MKKTIGFNTLHGPRYFNVSDRNVKTTVIYSGVFASSNQPELVMAVSYKELLYKLRNHFSIGGDEGPSSVQQYRNHLSALNGFLAFCGKSVDSNIGTELRGQFDETLDKFLSAIEVAPRTRLDRARQLKLIRRTLQQSDSPPSSQSSAGSFTMEFRRLVAASGIPAKTLAKNAGISPSAMWRWLAGTDPRTDSHPSLRRLETALGVPRNALVDLAVGVETKPKHEPVLPSHRVNLAARKVHGLCLSERELDAEFVSEWRNLFDYKIASFPSLERQSRGCWRLIPKTVCKEVSPLAQRGAMACPTADILISRLRSFFAVLLKLPVEQGGIAWSSEPRQSLALCAHPRTLECYLQWMTNRSGGVKHNGQKVFARAIASLVRPKTGYLWQLANVYQPRLPVELGVSTADEWRAMCEKSHKFLRDYVASARGTSRHPEEPIADLLSLADPLKPILGAIDRIQKDAAAAPSGGVVEARHKRNALLLALLLSNPLRARSLAALTWVPNGHGTLRGSSSTGWRLVLQPAHLKNGNSAGARAYSVKVADWVKPLLDQYIDEYRDTLLDGKSSDYLFVGDAAGGLWRGLGKTVLQLTRRYIPGSPGFGPHAVRHLVATSWLRKNPGDFLTVAELLNDSLKTVLENYAHLRRDDSFARYEAQIALSSQMAG